MRSIIFFILFLFFVSTPCSAEYHWTNSGVYIETVEVSFPIQPSNPNYLQIQVTTSDNKMFRVAVLPGDNDKYAYDRSSFYVTTLLAAKASHNPVLFFTDIVNGKNAFKGIKILK